MKGTWSPDYPWAPTEDEWRQRLAEIRDGWGRRDFFTRLLHEWAPDAPEDEAFLDWFVKHLRRSLSPGAAVALFRTSMESDVSGVLPAVRVPTLVLHKEAEREPAEYFAERVADCRLVSPPTYAVRTPGSTTPRTSSPKACSQFVAELGQQPERERILATILFTDIVGSTQKAADLGDGSGGPARTSSRRRARVRPAPGRGAHTAGDGFFASFDGPGRAIACARARSVTGHGSRWTSVRRPYGECERLEGKLGGLAVSIGARVASEAGPGEVLVTGQCAIS